MKQWTILLLFSWLSTLVAAQVTTSSIAGTVKGNNAQTLSGATVTAIHQPTGTTYTTTSRTNGAFTLPNLQVGGPYQITVTYTGYEPFRMENVNLLLGQPYTLDAVLGVNVQALETVVVTGGRGRRAPDRTGTSTNITNRQLNTLPTINRTITDFTRLTPQAGSNNSFGGRDPRFNNIQIDGANLNNNFGLSNDPLPGGGNPISLDAIEEISVNVSPFDVRQAGFTGAGINAVTRSGNNNFTGSVYGFYRNESFTGRRVGKVKLPPAQETTNGIYGFRLGGPIIRNKLFFFVNAERETREYPGVLFRPRQPGLSPGGNVAATPIDSLRRLSEFLISNYGYNPGAFDDFPNFNQENTKLLGRLDWNITTKHRATVRYSDFQNTNEQLLNATSIPGGGFGPLTRLGNNRFGPNSLGFQNSNYGFEDKVRTGTFEVNSRFTNTISNQLLATYTKIRTTRTFEGGVFPTIDFLNLPSGDTINNQNYMHVGMDPFTNNNDVINNIFSIIDNFTRNAGRHTITAGVSYEHQRVANMFMPGSNSYYIFRSLNDFITNQPPAYFAYTYSLIKGEPQVYSAELKIGQLGIYAQDEFNFSDRIRLIYGLRVDRPIYNEQPIANPAVESLTFLDEKGQPTRYSTGQ
ncbi:MAG TPA: carboxypeptidase regulatory-like domain-containing protein, partial [Flavisolibacter sp.]|nr:carboxypeptidase regulatory-like domain-containing protein [Flavisolibacter sp.]